MTEKLTIEQFQQIKSQLQQLIKQHEDYYEEHRNEPDYNDELFEQILISKYLDIQKHLLSYDLSEIPFEAWEEFPIFSDENHLVDFSKTKANIDFALVEYFGYGNFKGCNVKNLDKIERWLNPQSFDEQTIKMNSSLFLSDSFSTAFKDIYYNSTLTISDLAKLSFDQLEEIKHKNFQEHMDYENDRLMVKYLGFNKAIQLYNYSLQEYETIKDIFNKRYLFDHGLNYNNRNVPLFDELLEQLKTEDIKKMKNVCFDFIKQTIFNSSFWFINDSFPELFIKENPELFLINANVPEEVKNRYFDRRLKLEDLLEYPEAFQNIFVDNFMEYGIYISDFFRDNYGIGKFQELVRKYPGVFLHLIQKNNFYQFNEFLKVGKDAESAFFEAVKNYLLSYGILEQFKEVVNGQTVFNVPDWLKEMKYVFVDKLNTSEELMIYSDSTVILDSTQRMAIDTLNIENIRRFEQETGFFTHKGNAWSKDLEMLEMFAYYFHGHSPSELAKLGIDFKNGNLSYEEFLSEIAKCFDIMRKTNIFTDYPNYDWIQGAFRDNHPEIFLDLNAPEELKTAFYRNDITSFFLQQHKEYIPYLINKNLSNTIRADIKMSVPGMVDDQGHIFPSELNFINEYAQRYGNEKLLYLISKYGNVLSDITIFNFHDEIENEQSIEKSIRKAIYKKIINNSVNYSYLSDVPEMIEEYPDIFIDLSNLTNIAEEEKQKLTKAFYSKALSFDDIKNHPELVTVLKEKNLFLAFGNKDGNHINGRILLGSQYDRASSDLELLEVLGNEKFLELCAKYGRYISGIAKHLNKIITISNGNYVKVNDEKLNALSFEEISIIIEDTIAKGSKLGDFPYHPNDAPAFLRDKCPELFLSDDAPEELKQFFYNYNYNYPMTFDVLQNHKNWLPFLKDKSLVTALFRSKYLKDDLIKFLNLFGEEKAIKLGIARAETVKQMMLSHQVELMKAWYDKTGGKFIPDFVVMQNFRLEEADKFLVSGSNWSNLMRIKSFASIPEARDAMLKLAYSFGAFDQDQRGFKKLQDLLTGLPKKINAEQSYIFERMESELKTYSQLGTFFHLGIRSVVDEDGNIHRSICELENSPKTAEEKELAFNQMIDYVRNHFFVGDLLDKYTILNFFESIKSERIEIDFTKDIFSQIYRKTEDGSYILIINQQTCPKTTAAVREMLGKFREIPMLTPDKAHQLFGAFELKYDADFREFLLANIDKILENPEYISWVSSIQRQFSDIKAMNSNRVLTWELAVSFVQTNKYTSVSVGNEAVAEISAIAGYSQADFNMLQQIYNYGKQRTFSSIPRIDHQTEKASGKYVYETLRLDDPLALAIGTLTDCCQELNNCAEVCMEHSAVDKNGRVFVIKDEKGNIVAQSWVWRNKDVLCFDNIEIPEKVFSRIEKEHPEISRKTFTDELFEIYKQAAGDLIEADEKVFRKLLDSGKITQEEYDGLVLKKVTVGLGYNDIAASLQQNSVVDKGTISRPLPFEPPVKLSRGLYTNDSTVQYILSEQEGRKDFEGKTLAVHNDSYIEYTDANFTEKLLLSLNRLERVTKEDPRYLETAVSDFADSKHLVTELAKNYGLNPATTRIIIHPNFAIIYDINGDKLKIGDLLFNTKVDNGYQQMDIEKHVVMQIRLALDQISSDKKIDISSLDEKQKELYIRITELTNEMDVERGVGHAR